MTFSYSHPPPWNIDVMAGTLAATADRVLTLRLKALCQNDGAVT